MRRLLTLLTLVILGAMAQPSPYTTDGMSNGVLWRSIPESDKISYVHGAADGFVQEYLDILWATQGQPQPKYAIWFKSDPKKGDIVKEMDAFYQNISRPMIRAFDYSVMKLAGSSQQELDLYLTRFK